MTSNASFAVIVVHGSGAARAETNSVNRSDVSIRVDSGIVLTPNSMEWLPLELWRASSLAQETRTCEAAYERLSKSGNTTALAQLRKSMEGRIDELEAFFIDNVDDERAVLFEKQVC